MLSKIVASSLLFVVMIMGASQLNAGSCCAPEPVCVCPPPPVNVTFCVVDPCDGCTYQVTACVPAECACETPCLLTWKKGLLGRKVLTYKFPCCGECVEVVITRHGKATVRG